MRFYFSILAMTAIATSVHAGPKAGLTYLTDDIVVFQDDREPRRPAPLSDFADEDCKANVKNVVCLVNNADGTDALGRECAEGTNKYIPIFEALHDRFPPKLQKMFCAVRKIYVEKTLKSTAYASASGVIGIRQSLIDEKLDLAAWATWKEQLTFGGSLTSYATKGDLPVFATSSEDNANNFLYNVIAHEFGHLFDFANDLNESDGFKMKAGSWGDISWQTFTKPKAEFDFPNRNKVCFYDCGNHPLKKEAIPQIYKDLKEKSNFLNTYTSRNAYEDFADTFAFYVMFNHTTATYKIDTKQGLAYDVREDFKSDRLKKKVEYIKDFLAKDNIQYP